MSHPIPRRSRGMKQATGFIIARGTSFYKVICNYNLMLTDWFARKNLTRHSGIYNVYYY